MNAVRALAVVVALFAAVAPAYGGEDPRAIRLVDQNGASVSLDDLRGAPQVVTFVATRCTDACPVATGTFAALERRLRRERVRATLVTVTLDPEHDTPFAMAAYAARFSADGRDWRFLSGAPGAVRRLARSLGVAAVADERGVPDVHSTFVYVLDARARLFRTLLLSSGTAGDVDALLRSQSLARSGRP